MNCYACNTVVDKLLERIAELEQQKQVLIEQHDMWRQQWSELTQSLDIRDLEQQAKGSIDVCNKAIESVSLPETSALRQEYFKDGVISLAKAIQEQAAKLKEQGDER